LTTASGGCGLRSTFQVFMLSRLVEFMNFCAKIKESLEIRRDAEILRLCFGSQGDLIEVRSKHKGKNKPEDPKAHLWRCRKIRRFPASRIDLQSIRRKRRARFVEELLFRSGSRWLYRSVWCRRRRPCLRSMTAKHRFDSPL